MGSIPGRRAPSLGLSQHVIDACDRCLLRPCHYVTVDVKRYPSLAMPHDGCDASQVAPLRQCPSCQGMTARMEGHPINLCEARETGEGLRQAIKVGRITNLISEHEALVPVNAVVGVKLFGCLPSPGGHKRLDSGRS
jgi:hypothetical protein